MNSVIRATLGPGVVVSLLLGGCAFGRTEFKVVKSEPGPLPGVSTPVAAPQPAATPAPGPENAGSAGETTPAADLIRHVVLPGESLSRICRRVLGNAAVYPRAAEANRLADPNLIQPGQELVLDPAWVRSAAPVATPAPASAAAPARAVATPAAVNPAPAKTPAAAMAAVEFPRRENGAFFPGESLTFSVEYFGIAAGFATLAVERGPEINRRPTLHIIASARTHPAFEWFFKVRDRIESFIDAGGIFSWRYEKHLREGSYSNDSVIVYDQLHRQVIKDEGRTTIPATAWTQDVLSEFYYFRTLDFKLGQTVTIPVVADDGKSYEVVVSVLRRERVTVPAGTFDCIVVSPAMKFEGIFQQKGTIHIWLTDDAHRVPVLIKSQIVIGTIDIVLREATVVEEQKIENRE